MTATERPPARSVPRRPASGLLAGKRLLITGIASTDSIAFATATAAIGHGAEVVVTALERDLERATEACRELPEPVVPAPLDVTDPDDLSRLADEISRTHGSLDGALHAVAFAPRPALTSFTGVPAVAVEAAFRTSVHSYVALGQLLADVAPPEGASLVGLDFDAARAWPTYNWMGVCKAALESVNRYLARDLGARRIRSNLVAAGPLATRAASAIPGFDLLEQSWEAQAPLPWDIHDAAPVADAACFLLSDLARAVTGEILHVDAGHHAMAAPLGAEPMLAGPTDRRARPAATGRG